jgi:hypothetical protein
VRWARRAGQGSSRGAGATGAHRGSRLAMIGLFTGDDLL